MGGRSRCGLIGLCVEGKEKPGLLTRALRFEEAKLV
jgi:hypothetical protein